MIDARRALDGRGWPGIRGQAAPGGHFAGRSICSDSIGHILPADNERGRGPAVQACRRARWSQRTTTKLPHRDRPHHDDSEDEAGQTDWATFGQGHGSREPGSAGVSWAGWAGSEIGVPGDRPARSKSRPSEEICERRRSGMDGRGYAQREVLFRASGIGEEGDREDQSRSAEECEESAGVEKGAAVKVAAPSSSKPADSSNSCSPRYPQPLDPPIRRSQHFKAQMFVFYDLAGGGDSFRGFADQSRDGGGFVVFGELPGLA